MLFRKPFPLWINVSLFAGAISIIPLAGQLGRRPVSTQPRTLAELAERLSQCSPELYVVPQFPDPPGGSMWICTRPQSRECLQKGLIRDRERVKKGNWQGIVFCERMSEVWLIEDEFIQDHWGENGMRIGPFVLFGDPDLLQRIRDVILNCES